MDQGVDHQSGWDTLLLSKPAIFHVAKKTKVKGKLTVSRQNLAWIPDDVTTAQAVRAQVDSLKGQSKARGQPLLRITTETQTLIFEFQNEKIRDSVLDIIQSLIPSGQGKQGSSIIDHADMPRTAHKMEAEKRRLLDSNKDLRDLYQALVQGGVIADQEFWQTHEDLLQSPTLAPKATQQQGLSSLFTPEMTLQGDGASQKIMVQLTPETVRQIFSERPHVHRAFLELVPRTLDEKDFWSKFCKHEYALQVKRKKMAEGMMQEANQVDDEFADLFSEKPMTSTEMQATCDRVRRIDPTINLAANDDAALNEGYGLLHHAGKANTRKPIGCAHEIIRDLNRHAKVVLDGAPAWEANDPASVARKLELEKRAKRQKISSSVFGEQMAKTIQTRDGRPLDDLKEPVAVGVSELRIHNQGGQMEKTKIAPKTAKNYGCLGWLSPDSLKDLKLPAGGSTKVIWELHHGGCDSEPISSSRYSGRDTATELLLPANIRDLLRSKVIVVNELLRHFWRSFKLQAHMQGTKLTRIQAALCSNRSTLEEIALACPEENRGTVLRLIQPLLSALDETTETKLP